MTANQDQSGSRSEGRESARRSPPEWADGLKQLYDSVVEEALPDSFKDLLDRLDEVDPARGQDGFAPLSGGSDSGE
ncbi:MAG: NepR family anti-sigma factor [Erythrobacter sp.]